jgi:hypothetical protein
MDIIYSIKMGHKLKFMLAVVVLAILAYIGVGLYQKKKKNDTAVEELKEKLNREGANQPPPPIPKRRVKDMGWKPYGNQLLRRFVNSGPECFSYNAKDCVVFKTDIERETAMNMMVGDEVKPLICGSEHLAKWGTTGYENPDDWCNIYVPTM